MLYLPYSFIASNVFGPNKWQFMETPLCVHALQMYRYMMIHKQVSSLGYVIVWHPGDRPCGVSEAGWMAFSHLSFDCKIMLWVLTQQNFSYISYRCYQHNVFKVSIIILLFIILPIHPACWWGQLSFYFSSTSPHHWQHFRKHCMSPCLDAKYVYIHPA